jgi:diaminopimelate epimerase
VGVPGNGGALKSLEFVKAHADGNDFLFINNDGVASTDEASHVAKSVCDRHTGVGADGLIFYRLTALGAAMKLFNADGSTAEVSGNGVRCLGAIVAAEDGIGSETIVETDGGIKVLTLLDVDSSRYTFRTHMGQPTGLRELELGVEGRQLRVVVLSVGNPQCVVLTDRLDESRFTELGPTLGEHEAFPEGTNVEFVKVEQSDLLRILIWERGVGPTTSSGTGACASAVAAAKYGGANRALDVVSPGGTQHVEWDEDGIYLTGSAELIAYGKWLV